MSSIMYAYTIIALFQPSQAKKQRVAREILRIREFVVHVAHTTMPWSGRRGLPGSGICNFLEVDIKRLATSLELIERRLIPEKTKIQADHHWNRDSRASKTYATIGMGVTYHIERLGAYSWHLSR